MAFQLELNQFISGERFQALADISLIPYGSDVGEKEFYFVKEQQKNNNYKAFYYDESTKSLPDEVHNARVLFVNTWTLRKFFNIIFPLLKNSHVFISHNSDMALEPDHVKYLEDARVIKWFSQNAYIQHPKLFALPIGLGNQQYPHGNLPLLKSNIETKHTKKNLVFKNFSIDTNRAVRTAVNQITQENEFAMFPSMSQDQYFYWLATCAFSISPPGNGVDCHRVWESLYHRVVPIVQKHPCFEQFSHLPILFIDDWRQVTKEFLRSKLNMMNEFPDYIKELDMRYWEGLIK
jgi:hypothetical protein